MRLEEHERYSRIYQIPNCRLIQKIGEGGMGWLGLYERTDEEGRKSYVIGKSILHRELIKDSSSTLKEHFKEEFEALYYLGGEKTPRPIGEKVIENETTGNVHILMQYVPGITLKDIIYTHRESGKLIDTGVAEAIILETADALKKIHTSVWHRDISPQNIMVIQTEVPIEGKFIDLGLAIRKESEEDEYKELERTDEGNILYIAPEHIKGRIMSAASDIYQFGEVAYELLTNEHAFCNEYTIKESKERNKLMQKLDKLKENTEKAYQKAKMMLTKEKKKVKEKERFGDRKRALETYIKYRKNLKHEREDQKKVDISIQEYMNLKKVIYEDKLDGNYNPIRKINPDVSKGLAEIIDRCLENEPEYRYQRVEDLITDIEDLSSLNMRSIHEIRKFPSNYLKRISPSFKSRLT